MPMSRQSNKAGLENGPQSSGKILIHDFINERKLQGNETEQPEDGSSQQYFMTVPGKARDHKVTLTVQDVSQPI